MTASSAEPARVLVVDDEEGIRTTLEVLFRRSGHAVDLASGGAEAIRRLREAAPFDLVVTDLMMPGIDGIGVLRAAKDRAPETQVLIVTAHATVETAIEAMRLGAYDYVQKPFSTEELRVLADKAIEKRRLLAENLRLRARVAGRRTFGEIVGRSDAMAQVLDLCRRAARIPTNVLLTGESGTGKELIARAIHHEGTRADKPFVVVDCGAIPETLIESELFGHVRGAFTGAVAAQPGLFRFADGGTVFLDEVAELPPGLQVKLLRVLQERVVKPVGGVEEIAVDLRVIAATNRDLEEEIRAGRFREDLYYRLNVLRIEIPPLRDRVADVPELAEYFLARHGEILGRRLDGFEPEAMRLLLACPFSGNVRELANIIERAVVLAEGVRIGPEALRFGRSVEPSRDTPLPARPAALPIDAFLGQVERKVLTDAIAEVGLRHRDLAQHLGITERSLRYRLGKHRILPTGADGDPGSTKVGESD
jgi:two-component system response regulator PilR (NtrC family)